MLKKLADKNLNYKDLIRLKLADKKGAMNDKKPLTITDIKEVMYKIKDIIDKKEPFGLKDLAVNGNDVMNELNLKPCPKVGIILNLLLSQVMNDPGLNNKEILLTLAKKFEKSGVKG